MTTAIEVVFEDHVLKPIGPIEGLREHERVWALIRPLRRGDILRNLVGTLDHEEAQTMRETINREFEKIEGEW